MLAIPPSSVFEWSLACLAGAASVWLFLRKGGRAQSSLIRQLEESEARYRGIVDHAAEGIITINSAGLIESFNAAAEEIFGYESSEVLGQSVAMLASDEGLREAQSMFADRVSREQPGAIGGSLELEGKRKRGAGFPVRLSLSAVDVEGDVVYTAIVADLSAARTIEAQLVQAQKLEAIGQLAAGVAHEINTPAQYVTDNVRFLEEAYQDLQGLLEFLSQLDGEQLPPAELFAKLLELRADADLDYLVEEMPKALAQSLQGLDNVTRIVRAMKEFSHPGGQDLAVVDLNRALGNAMTVARNEWRYVAEVSTQFDSNLQPIPVFEGEMNQVFLNLLVNAAHAVQKSREEGKQGKGQIFLSTLETTDCVEIRIQDDGAGIPQEIRQRIFDPFFTTKGVGRGTGQGLALVHSVIVDKHGGEIRVESEVGVGTTFVIRLPREQAELQAA